MTDALGAAALDQLFLEARSRNAWKDEVLPEETWHRLYDLVKMGPTSANVSPARFVFLTTPEAKARILPLMSKTNAEKSAAAPAIVIIGQDMDFAEQMPKLFPHNETAKYWFSDPKVREDTAMRNSSLQGAYLMLAARALGLDCGPMSGFEADKVDAEFFAGTAIRTNFICTLGHGIDTPFDRLPRLAFEEACQLL